MELFKDFFACRIVLAADQRYPEIIQRVFHREKYLCLKSSTTWKHSKTFSPAELSQLQINDILNLFKDFFTCRKVLVSNHQQHGNIQRLFRLQNCLGRKSSISQNYSKNFSPAELSQPQINDILNLFKDLFTGRKVLVSIHQQHGNIQRLFRLQNCLGRKSSKSQIFSKTFSPAELSQPQINDTLKLFKDFFACRLVLDANHQYPKFIQRLFSPAELSQPQINDTLKFFKDFFTGRINLVSNHQQHGNIQIPFRLQNCLGRKLSISQNYSKTFFSPAELSQPQSTIP